MVDLEELRVSHRKNLFVNVSNLLPADIIVFEGGNPRRGNNYFSVAVDLTNVNESVTLRTFKKVDYVNYKLDKITVYPDDFDSGIKGVLFILDGTGGDMKIEIQSNELGVGEDLVSLSYSETRR